jgi:secondary thiamine-phosphate synthase enzyme
MKPEQIVVRTKEKQEIFDITDHVKRIVEKSKVKDGLCIVYTPHATCGIIVNENYDPSICEDIITALNRMIPERAGYKHDAIDRNAYSHIKASIIGPSEAMIIKDSKLLLGRWQGIALAEFDGPRERKIFVKILEDLE